MTSLIDEIWFRESDVINCFHSKASLAQYDVVPSDQTEILSRYSSYAFAFINVLESWAMKSIILLFLVSITCGSSRKILKCGTVSSACVQVLDNGRCPSVPFCPAGFKRRPIGDSCCCFLKKASLPTGFSSHHRQSWKLNSLWFQIFQSNSM